MSDDEDSRYCPYCGVALNRPYWQHIQNEHKEKYEAKETWTQLYKDYKSMGMDHEKCVLVISELFNATNDEIESFLKDKGVL